MDKKLFKNILFIIAYSVLLVAVIINIEWIIGAAGWFLGLLSPIFIGFSVAFVLNRPYMFFFRLYTTPLKKKSGKKNKKPEKERSDKSKRRILNLKKALALLTVYILFLAVIALLLWLVIPEFSGSVTQIASNFDEYGKNLNKILTDVEEWLPFDFSLSTPTTEETETENLLAVESVPLSDFLSQKTSEFFESLPETISGLIPNLFDFTKSVASSIINGLLGFVMSVYMLASKESLITQLKKIFNAFVPKKFADRTYEVLGISNEMFSNFLLGRLLEASIVGLLCFIGMTIFGFQYTLLISVVVGVTNIIPFFGPFIGAIPSIFLLLVVDPMQAVWFTVFIIVLQQIDGNLIGPKIVGDSMGMPAWWVMVAILIGGGLMGIPGMLIGVPMFAVIYKLLSKTVAIRLQKKNLALKEAEKQDG
ncbi:MAG: AI-2E family transporter [Clostridia bacterium]|nr:AI-2E family transporter [Clostridia bacterium]